VDDVALFVEYIFTNIQYKVKEIGGENTSERVPILDKRISFLLDDIVK